MKFEEIMNLPENEQEQAAIDEADRRMLLGTIDLIRALLYQDEMEASYFEQFVGDTSNEPH